MRERILFFRDNDDYKIEESLGSEGAFKQEALKRGGGLAKINKGDLVHILTEQNYEIKYTCTVVNVNIDEEFALLAWYDEYDEAIPLSFLETNGFENIRRSRKNWDFVNGLYEIIKQNGTRQT